jgi:NAD(P)-dependent dehydrogenase (short-subunit alcohol dehydrogenase family)
MKIILVGASGTIGNAVGQALSERHEILRVGRSGGDIRADIADPDALRAMFRTAAPYDAVVCAAGLAAFGELDRLTDEEFQLGLSSKLMGQVNLVRLGLSGITDAGSFTLTSGVLSQEPIPGSSAISMVNAGVEAFVRAAAWRCRAGCASTWCRRRGFAKRSRPWDGTHRRVCRPRPLRRHMWTAWKAG